MIKQVSNGFQAYTDKGKPLFKPFKTYQEAQMSYLKYKTRVKKKLFSEGKSMTATGPTSKLTKAAMVFNKYAESNYLSDFVYGMEPTGKFTLESSMKNKKNHGKHRFFGDLGGAVSGAVVAPAATGGLTLLLSKLLKRSPSTSKVLHDVGKDMLELYNLKKVKQTFKNFSQGIRTGQDTMNKSKKMIEDIDDIRKTYETVGKGSQITEKDILTNIDKLHNINNTSKEVSDTLKAYKNKVGESPVETVRRGTALASGLLSAGVGASINTLSAHTQYNMGRKIKEGQK